jgi:hypothetical protein
VLPIIEATLAGFAVGIIKRILARIEPHRPEDIRREMHRDDSSASAAFSGTVELPHIY